MTDKDTTNILWSDVRKILTENHMYSRELIPLQLEQQEDSQGKECFTFYWEDSSNITHEFCFREKDNVLVTVNDNAMQLISVYGFYLWIDVFSSVDLMYIHL